MICCKSCRVAFCLVLQFTATILGCRKNAMIHSSRPLVFALMGFFVCFFFFLLCILIRIFYSEENNQNHQPTKTRQYSAGEEKCPYFLFHKILKFLGETAYFSEKFQGEIAEFLIENVELSRQNLKISGRNTGIS